MEPTATPEPTAIPESVVAAEPESDGFSETEEAPVIIEEEPQTPEPPVFTESVEDMVTGIRGV